MAMIVMGGMCVQSITAIRTIISNFWAAMLETVLYSLRLFVVGCEHIAMAMVVVEHICTQNMMDLEEHMFLHYNVLPEAVCCCLLVLYTTLFTNM